MTKSQIMTIEKKLLEQKEQLIREARKTISEELAYESGNLADYADQSSEESDRSFVLRLRDRERKLISKIDETLERIKNNSYGTCESCGGKIGSKRLEARPIVTLCINCKKEQEYKEGQQQP
ncbi:MAG: RNA polymerase-binding protein DksA [bacterium]